MISNFLERYGWLAWAPGEVDCTLMLADWWIANGRPDAADGIRGTYSDVEGFRAIVRDAGGLVDLIDRCAPIAGGARTDQLAAGVIGVIGSRTDMDRQFGALFDGHRWWLRDADGVHSLAARPLALWDLG